MTPITWLLILATIVVVVGAGLYIGAAVLFTKIWKSIWYG